MKEKLYCPVRKRWIKEQPEELLRQQMISEMLACLGYPQALLAVEKGLNQLPYLERQNLPKRRIDILAFHLLQGSLSPLLLVECKAAVWTDRAILQLLGYNRLIQAPFITLASLKGVCTLSYDGQGHLVPLCQGIPSFATLISLLAD
ncbi:MAG: hypothetical protein K0S07_1755 [Chlamydiales bacterium]|jgi:hypothetical protein|nr:hypothetical protein [Chlamydiales bacterium]